jgi:hypothetical protein
LSTGLGFKPNCVAEDVFIHAVLNASFELGWRRIDQYCEPLPVTEKDRDFTRVHKLAANEEIAQLAKAPATVEGKKKFQIDLKLVDVKSWFKCYDVKLGTMFDHVVMLHEDDTDNWSVSSGSTLSTASGTQSPGRSKERAESISSDVSDGPQVLDPCVSQAATFGSKLSASNLAALAERLGTSKIEGERTL